MDERQHCKRCGKQRTAQVFNEDYCAICLVEEDIRIKEIYNKHIIPWLETGVVQDPRAIFIWSFYDAPEGLRMLSVAGGDEDWLVYVPSAAAFVYTPRWLSSLGADEPDEFKLPNGATVYIADH